MARRRGMDFEALYAKGELAGTDGFQAHTPNGTSFWKGTGWNRQWDQGWESPQVEPDKTRPAGRSNRTGE